MRARLIQPDGTTRQISLAEGGKGWLDLCAMLDALMPSGIQLQKMAPGRVGLTLWHDPAALESDTARSNDTARKIVDWLKLGPEYICGNAIITGGTGSDGQAHGLTLGQDQILTELIKGWETEKPSAALEAAGHTMFASLDQRRAS